MHFIGDIHAQMLGSFSAYRRIIKRLPRSIQLGDLNLGVDKKLDKGFPNAHPDHMFIRGNHDNPEVCRQLQSHLGDYGYLEDDDIFFVGGGYSIDKDQRVIGINWWPDEELGYQQCAEAISLYMEKRPRIAISHECPSSVRDLFSTLSLQIRPSRTSVALQDMLDAHRPRFWVFGHHHETRHVEIDGTVFLCVGSSDVKEIK